MLLILFLGVWLSSDSPSGARRGEQAAPSGEYLVGEAVTVGDLTVTVTTCERGKNVSILYFRVTNNHPGKVHEWEGWQHDAFARDEHGNRFKPFPCADGDWGKTRIEPGQTYSGELILYRIPATSQQAVLRAPVAGRTVTWRLTR
jgi:hypothetical protein